jgi:hypothetical protein
MSALTITSESAGKLFGRRQEIDNDMGITLSYRTGMILGTTCFYKQNLCWLSISNKGELSVDGRLAGIIKNKCAPAGGNTVIATITSANECSMAIVSNKEAKNEEEILFLKEGKQIAAAKGTHNSLLINFDNHDDLWIVLVLGWCSLHYVFLRVWDRITYFEPEPDKPIEEGKAKK